MGRGPLPSADRRMARGDGIPLSTMAPSRGAEPLDNAMESSQSARGPASPSMEDLEPPPPRSRANDPDDGRNDAQRALAYRATQPTNFTIRGLICGLVIGIVVVFSNTYFGLQTGWISGMSMPAALISFAIFRAIGPLLSRSFSPMENVFIQSVSGSVGTMPLGCGFVGVIPALEYLLKKEENGPLHLSTGRLILWAVGICLFGVVFAVPLRREVIIREKLRFPSGTATALMIGVLHGGKDEAKVISQDDGDQQDRSTHNTHEENGRHDRRSLESSGAASQRPRVGTYDGISQAEMLSPYNPASGGESDWKAKIRLMIIAFSVSAAYTVTTYFVPGLRNIPIFGLVLARDWLWTLNPSPAYVGQGIIMGPWTTAHMALGAIIGWGILSPMAKANGWAPGPVSDWGTGSKGWIVWVSLAIMLADALVSLGWLIARPLVRHAPNTLSAVWSHVRRGDWRGLGQLFRPSPTGRGYRPVDTTEENDTDSSPLLKPTADDADEEPEADAPASQLVSRKTFLISLAVSVALYFISVHLSFPNLMNFALTLLALILAGFLSLLGVRALGETDLNPVSGISKLTQLIFALVVPSNGNPNAVTINLLAGAISESGAIQAGDLLQDLKAGHLLGASPAAQYWGQIAGSIVGAAASAVVYRLYTSVYTIPSGEFQVPTGYVWVFTARLVTGEGLPPRAAEAALVFGVVWAVLTVLRAGWRGRAWTNYVPGGIAVAVGMYNTPSFTFARAFGGLVAWWWTRWRGRDETTVVVLASGLILGEGLFSIVNLGLASAEVPHFGDWT